MGGVVMADLHGTLTTVSERTMGDTLDTAASAGAQTLSLYDVSDFDEDGGTVTINGVVYTYDTVDMDADTVHITTPLTGAAAVDDAVSLWDTDHATVVTERVALVAVDGQEDGDSITADIDYSLTPLLAQETLAAGQSVTVVRENSGFRLVEVHGRANQGVSVGVATIYSGDGAPTFSADQGSLYIRRDGAAGTRIYFNTANGASWTGIV